jgi:receptor protein-tyrosine kinase
LSLHDFLSLLRSRWLTIVSSVLIAVAGAVALALLTTPTYVAYTRLFVSTPRSGSVTDLYQGDLFTQERVFTYAELLKGQKIAQRTIDKLHLDMTVDQLRSEVTPVVARDTILIYLYISDSSPERARDVANTMSEELVILVEELENPPNVASPGVPGRVIIEQHATLPTAPAKPNKRRNLFAGFAVGVLAGIGLAFYRAIRDDRVTDEDELNEITGVGALGTVPREHRSRRGPPAPPGPTGPAGAEAFRVIRTNLKFVDNGHPPRLILIASPTDDDGRTTVALNTALALAETAGKVAVVDADLRRPALSTALGLATESGLSTVITGETSLSAALQETRYPHLTAISSGPIPSNPSALLDSEPARRVLQELVAQFDYVILDSPPLTTAADAIILAAACHGVIFVARHDKTKSDDIRRAVDALNKVGAVIIGTVFTAVPMRRAKTAAEAS